MDIISMILARNQSGGSGSGIPTIRLTTPLKTGCKFTAEENELLTKTFENSTVVFIHITVIDTQTIALFQYATKQTEELLLKAYSAVCMGFKIGLANISNADNWMCEVVEIP